MRHSLGLCADYDNFYSPTNVIGNNTKIHKNSYWAMALHNHYGWFVEKYVSSQD